MTKWYLYIIENKYCHYYTGICTDINRRFEEHQANGVKCAKALKGKGPLTLRFQSIVGSHSEALKAEIWVKKLTKAKKIELVNNRLIGSSLNNMLLSKDN